MPLIFLAAAVLGIQTPSAALTHSYGVMRADLLVKAISDQTGWGLSAGPSLKQDYVYANVKGLTKEQAMAALAGMLQAKWKPKNGGQELSSSYAAGAGPSPSARKRVHDYFVHEKLESKEFTTAEAQDILKDWTRQTDSTTATEDDKRDWQHSRESRLPYPRAARAAVLSLGEDFWSTLSPGTKVVFSEKPTLVERPFTPALAGVLDRLKSEFRVYADVVSQFSRRPDEHIWDASFTPYLDVKNAFEAIEVVAKNENATPTCEIKIWGPGMSSQWIGSPVWIGGAPGTEKAPTEQEILESFGSLDPRAPLGLSEDWKKDAESVMGVYRGHEMPLGQIAPRLVHPEKGDLLDLVAREPLDRLSAATGRGLMAVVPDSAIHWNKTAGLTCKDAVIQMCRPGGDPSLFKREAEGENDVLSFERMDLCREERFDREAVARLAGGIEGGGPLLDLLAEFCLARPSGRTVAIVLSYVRQPDGERIGFLNPSDQPVLRLYGRLSASLRAKAASEGVELAYAGLPPASKEDWNSLVYCFTEDLDNGPSNQASRQALPPEMAVDSGPLADPFADSRERRSPLSAYATQPSRALGSGIPSNSTILFRVEGRPVWFGLDSNSPYNMASPVRVADLANAIVMTSKGDSRSWYGYADSFFLGSTQRLAESFSFPGAGTSQRFFMLNTMDRKNRLTLDTLPEEARKAIQKAVERSREMLKSLPAKSGSGGAVSP